MTSRIVALIFGILWAIPAYAQQGSAVGPALNINNISGFGTGVAAAAAINLGSAGALAGVNTAQTFAQTNFFTPAQVFGDATAGVNIQGDVSGVAIISGLNTLNNSFNNLDFYGGGVRTLRVDTSAGVSIGTITSPGAGGLQVNGQTFIPNMSSDSGIADSTVCTATTGGKLLKGSGTLGICLGTSSARYKNHIVPMNEGLDKLAALLPKNFYYNKGHGDGGAREQYGFIAEDVIQVLPKLVPLDSEGKPSSVDLVGMIPIIVRGMQQLEADNNNLRARVVELEKRKQ